MSAHAKPSAPPQPAAPQVEKQEEQELVTPTTHSFGDTGGEDAPSDGGGANSGDVQTQLNQAVSFGHSFGQMMSADIAPPMQLKRREGSLLDSFAQGPMQTQQSMPLVQTKLTIGQPGDKYEQEADRMAARVMAMPDSAVQRETMEEEEETLQTKPLLQRQEIKENEDEELLQSKPLLQRQEISEEEDEETLQTKPQLQREEISEEDDEETLQTKPQLQREAMPEEEDEENLQAKPLLQRQTTSEDEDEKTLQTKPQLQAKGGVPQAPDNFESQLAQHKGSGQPLSDETRAFMEPRFGADFGNVRIHETPDLASSIQAQAFTHGQDIYFNSGKYNPGSSSGKTLLAHELTHTVQQAKETRIQCDSSETGKDYEEPAESEKTNKTNLIDLDDDSKIKEIINSFPHVVQKKFTSDVNKQRSYLKSFLAIFKSIDKLKKHFMSIEEVALSTRGHGSVVLHKDAAARLKSVEKEMISRGSGMPYSAAGLSFAFRNLRKGEKVEQWQAHRLGLAIDYRPRSNPQIKGRRSKKRIEEAQSLIELINLQTGGESSFAGKYGGREAHRKRRRLIKEMGIQSQEGGIKKESKLGQRAAFFFEDFATQFYQLSETSDKFRRNSSAQLKQLKDLQIKKNEIQSLKIEINRMRKGGKKDSQDFKEKVKKRKRLENELNSGLKNTFRPLISKIDQEIDEINSDSKSKKIDIDKVPKKGKLNSFKRKINSLDKKVSRQLNRLKNGKKVSKKNVYSMLNSDILKRIQNLRHQTKIIEFEQKETSHSNQKEDSRVSAEETSNDDRENNMENVLDELEKTIAGDKKFLNYLSSLLTRRKKINSLEFLKERLLTDHKFVFSDDKIKVNAPSVMQLMEKGFFNPDEDLEEGEKFDPKKHGFTLDFMRVMAKYGFDQGVQWSPVSSDPMHFEFVQGMDALS